MKAATPSATRGLADRFLRSGFSSDAYRLLGRTGLVVSAVGFGAYRVDDRTPDHRAALEKALAAGCNLIDTSTNYTDGESESCIGNTLAALTASGEVLREDRVIVSKIGYVQGQNLDLARSREESGDPFPGMVKISEGCWHCVHPAFLEDQLGRSLDRLKVDRLDACLLHNPEYFLEDTHRRGAPLEEARREFYGRIRSAFAHLEGEVERGRISWYGVSSNSFGAPPDDPESTSLGRMLAAAREAARDAGHPPDEHHFAVAQLPMNLYETGPATTGKEGADEDRSAIAFAAANGIGVLVNRPLNAFTRGEMVRLADFPAEPPEVSISEALERVSDLEREFAKEIGRNLRLPEGGPRMEDLFAWGKHLAGAEGRIGGYEQWLAIQDQQIYPRLFQAVGALREALPPEPARLFREWLDRYLADFGKLLGAFRADFAGRSQARSRGIASAIDPALPADLRRETLSRKALSVVASVEGVTSVLNGMRHPAYVEDSIGILKWPRIPAPLEAFARL